MGRVMVTALDAFYGSEEGKVEPGQTFAVNEGYARELERNGHVTIGEPATDDAPAERPASVLRGTVTTSVEEKVAPLPVVVEPAAAGKSKPDPANKMNPSPSNKAA